MSKIKGKNTKPETRLRKALFELGYRYRVNDSRFPGTPDIVLPQYKTIIFVHGCFWHGHNCRCHVPKTNTEFWVNKIERNKARDMKTELELLQLGWQIIIVWECEIKTSLSLSRKIVDIAHILKRRKWALLERNAITKDSI